MSLEELSASLDNLLKIVDYGESSNETIDTIKDMTSRIINKIVWKNSKLYLVDNSTTSDQLLNLQTGMTLIKASQFETSEYTKPIGEALIDSFLSHRNYRGDVPKTIEISSDQKSTETIPGEDIYLLIEDAPFTPHFYQDGDILVYTIAETNSEITMANGSYKEIRINTTYPFNTKLKSPHTVIISGIKPHKQLQLGTRVWRPYPLHEEYYVGYYYDQQPELLFVMLNMSDKGEIMEEIKVSF